MSMDQVIQSWEWIKAVMALRDPETLLDECMVLEKDAQDALSRLRQALDANNLLQVQDNIQRMEEFIFYPSPVPDKSLPPDLVGRTAGRSFVAARTRAHAEAVPVQVRRFTPEYRRFQAIELGLAAIQGLVQLGQYAQADSLAQRLFAAHALSHDPSLSRMMVDRALEEAARAQGLDQEAQMARRNAEDIYDRATKNRANYDSARTLARLKANLFPDIPPSGFAPSSQGVGQPAPTSPASSLVSPPRSPSPPNVLTRPGVSLPPPGHPYTNQQTPMPADQQARLNWRTRMPVPVGGDVVHEMEVNRVWIPNRVYGLNVLENQDCVEYQVSTSYALARVGNLKTWSGNTGSGELWLIDRTNKPRAGSRLVFRNIHGTAQRYTSLRRPSTAATFGTMLRLRFLRRPGSLWGTAVTSLRPLADQTPPAASLRLPANGPVMIDQPEPGPATRQLEIQYLGVSSMYIDGRPYATKPLRGQPHYLLDTQAEYFLVRVNRAASNAVIMAGEYLLVKKKAVPANGDYVVVVGNGSGGYDLEGGCLLRQYLECDGRIELRPNQSQPPEHPSYFSPIEVEQYKRGVVVACFAPI